MTSSSEHGPELHVRPFEPEFATRLAAFAVQAYADTYGYELDPSQRSAEEKLSARQFIDASKSDTLLVANMDTEIVGYVQCGGNIRDPEDVKELRKLYVAKQLHGRGIGSRLLEEAFADPVLESASHVYLWVWGQNSQAIRFYEKYGFMPFTQRLYLTSNGSPTFDLAMVKTRNE